MTERRQRQNHIARASWLLMLEEGGRWSAAEISERLNRNDSREFSFHSRISRMAEDGYAMRFHSGERQRGVKYGVTPDCKVPTGVTVEQILKAMQA